MELDRLPPVSCSIYPDNKAFAKDQIQKNRYAVWTYDNIKENINFYISQALFFDALKGLQNAKTRQQIEQLLLHRGCKISKIYKESRGQLQLSPIDQNNPTVYHRMSKDGNYAQVEEAFAQKLGIDPENLILLDPSAEELFRFLIVVMVGKSIKITNRDDLSFNFYNPAMFFKKDLPHLDISNSNISFADLINLYATEDISSLAVISFFKFKGELFLFHYGKNFPFNLRDIAISAGLLTTPEGLKRAWLQVRQLSVILFQKGVKKAFWPSGGIVPTIYSSFDGFCLSAKFEILKRDFKGHSKEVLVEATINLLEGLKDKNVDSVYREKGLSNLLQYTYYRLLNALKEIHLWRDNQIKFINQLDLIHQEIQAILTIVAPYNETDLQGAVLDHLTKGNDPIIPIDYGNAKVHLKTSGMTCYASIIATIQKHKGQTPIKALMQHGIYFEMMNLTKVFCKERVDVVRGNEFFTTRASLYSQYLNNIDLFVCEKYHNFHPSKRVYYPEDVVMQVNCIMEHKKPGCHLHVIVDVTFNDPSNDIRKEFLTDPKISSAIKRGALSVYFIHSAQKYDMFGFDNYFASIAIAISCAQNFDSINAAISPPGSQLLGGELQGPIHLWRYAAKQIDEYREVILRNTQWFYKRLPKKMIYFEGNENPIYVSRMKQQAAFLIFTFSPRLGQKSGNVFMTALLKFAEDNGLLLTVRGSFGFSNANLAPLSLTQDQIPRFTIGLEDSKSLELYLEFLEEMQKVFDFFLERTEEPLNKIKEIQNKINDLYIAFKKRIELIDASIPNEKNLDFVTGYNEAMEALEHSCSHAEMLDLNKIDDDLEHLDDYFDEVCDNSLEGDSIVDEVTIQIEEFNTVVMKTRAKMKPYINVVNNFFEEFINGHYFPNIKRNAQQQKSSDLHAVLYRKLLPPKTAYHVNFPIRVFPCCDDSLNPFLKIVFGNTLLGKKLSKKCKVLLKLLSHPKSELVSGADNVCNINIFDENYLIDVTDEKIMRWINGFIDFQTKLSEKVIEFQNMKQKANYQPSAYDVNTFCENAVQMLEKAIVINK
jgi:hypothetical protein